MPNRVVMASLARGRADVKTRAANEMLAEFYAKRASAGMIITECAYVSEDSDPFIGSANIYSQV